MEMDNNKIQILDVIGMPTNNLLFSSLNDTLIYSIGSTLIFYNLQKNIKTFLQYYTKNEISTLKYIDSKELILLSVDKSSNPLLCIWQLPLFEEIFSEKIQIFPNFHLSNIFIEKINSNLFIIIITAIDCNFIYALKNNNFSNFNLIKIGLIPNLEIEIEGFKCFYDDIYLIFLMNNNLQYYLINTNDILNNNKNDIIKLYKKIVLPFKLIGNSLSISNLNEIISFITSKGNCLIYNKSGDSLQSINPLDKEEMFTCNQFSGNSLCLGSNFSKIYIYNIGDFKLKYFIKENVLNNIKINFQLNNGKNKQIKNIPNEDKNIEFIKLNEKLDKIFIKLSNNSFLFAPLTSLMYDSRGLFNFNSLGNTKFLYSYNHSKSIISIEILNNFNEFETTIYTCSKDQTLMRYNIEYNTNKLSNLYFDLNEILNNNENKNDNNDYHNENEESFNNNFNDNNNIYLTIIKFHPFHNTKLYAGDNKGYLYIFDIKTDYFQYKKYIIDNYSIESLSFSKECNLICIGLITGKMAIYDINKNMKFCLKLCDDYLSQNEIDFRIKNYHIITYSYFFKSQKHKDCILFLKNSKNLEYSKLYYDEKKNGLLRKKNIILNELENIILDVQVHISENYLIALNDKNKIIINEINLGETTAVIDLSNQVNQIYNFEIERSGLYLAAICSLNKKNNNDENNDLIIFEIGTGNIVSYIKCIGMVYRIIFDYFAKFIIMAGHKGELSLWKLPYEMSNVIINVLSEIEKNKDFWEQFEIKYYSNNNNNYENMTLEEGPRIFRTDYNFKNDEEVFDNGPHKGIQTAGYNDINNKGNKMNNPTERMFNNLLNDMKDDNFKINDKDSNENMSYKLENNYINEINKTISMKNNNIINRNDSSNDNNNNYYYNSNNKDKNINNVNNKYNSFVNIEKYDMYNNYSNSKTNNYKSNHFNNLDNNLKNENSLQNCYEKFKKERLMKKSLLKPNTKINKSKNQNKNLFNKNNFNSKNYKSQNKKQKKLNSFSSPKISTSKKYLKDNSQIINKNLFSKEKFNKKEIINPEEDIDFEIDFDINKIRPNFDPNLYSNESKKEYSQTIKGLIQPLISSNYERYFSRYNEFEKRDKNIDNGLKNLNLNNLNIINNNNNNKNNNINKKIENNSIQEKEMPISECSKKSIKSDKNYDINKAIDVLLDSKDKKSIYNEIKNNNNDFNKLIYGNNYRNLNSNQNYKDNILNKNNEENSISSRDISHNMAYINNNKIESFSNRNLIDNISNKTKEKKSILSRDVSHNMAFINNQKIEPFNTTNYSNNTNNFIPNYEIKDLHNNFITTSNVKSNFSNKNSNNYINKINENNLKYYNKKDSLSTEKRRYLEDKINNFESNLNYY